MQNLHLSCSFLTNIFVIVIFWRQSDKIPPPFPPTNNRATELTRRSPVAFVCDIYRCYREMWKISLSFWIFFYICH